METKTDNNIPDLQDQREKLRAKIYEMEKKEREVKILEAKKKKEDKLIKARITCGSKKKVLEIYVKDYSKYTRFLSQIKFFEKHWDNWVKAKENLELEFKEEMDLLGMIGRQYTSCIEILRSEVSRDMLGLRNELNAWQKKVDKRLDKLEKKQ